MDAGESELMKIFLINKSKGEVKQKILEKIKSLCEHEISFNSFENFFRLLFEIKDNDKVNSYIEQITKHDKNFKFKTISELINLLQPDLEKTKLKLEKLNKISPLVSFLSSEFPNNPNDDIYNLIKKIEKLQSNNCFVKEIIAIDKQPSEKYIQRLLNIDNAFTLPSNVFYRFSLKKLYENGKINDTDSLIDNIENIKDITKNQINIYKIKQLKIQVFKNEIIQKTQELMKSVSTKIANKESQVSNLIHQRIESNYLEFAKLSDDDKLFLQTTIARIIHFDDFKKLGSFFDTYFKSRRSHDSEIKCFINVFKEHDPSIEKFQEFNKSYKDYNLSEVEIAELQEMKWPEFKEIGIEVHQISQFFTFWNCIIQLLSLKIDSKNKENELLFYISEFLKDKNIYTQFLKKMQQAYIEPTIQNYYIIFESLMKMLNASGIASPKSNFKNVSKAAASFFQENLPEFYKISNGINTLLNNENKIHELISLGKTNGVIAEYYFVKKVVDKDLYWEVSVKNHIRLMNKKQIAADFVKLKLITAKLSISIIKPEYITKSDEFKNSEEFVRFFQTAESLYDKLSILHNLNFDIGDKVITDESLDFKPIAKLNSNLEKVIQIINDKFLQVYKDHICLFTKEQFFSLYQLINKYFKNNEKSSDLVSIFEGTIISTYIAKTKNPVEDYYKLFKNKLELFDFDDDYSKENIDKFETNLSNFSKILANVIDSLIKERKKFDEYSFSLESTGNLDSFLAGRTVKCINTITTNITTKYNKKINITSKYQLHSLILYLLKSYQSYHALSLPFPTQLLICSMNITQSQIDSFLGYFITMTNKREKLIFIIVSPIQLQPTLFDYLITKLKEINENIISSSRIVILFENDDLSKKTIFRDVFRNISVESFTPIYNTEALNNLYKSKGFYGIQAYYIYERFPRTGKTHTILEHIHKNYPEHIYTRILVDESTSLTTLINSLNAIRKVDNKNKSIIIHFNIDSKCNTNFHLYIQNLAFLRSLNDGVSIPFISNDKMVFYFEFGSRPAFDKSDFIQNVFPIADYIEEIKIQKKTDEFFTYDEYHTVPHKDIDNALMIDKRDNYRKYLIEAATIARLDQDKDKDELHVRYKNYIDNYQRYYDELENDPKLAYYFLLGMFKEVKNVQDDFKVPLISQINDVSKIISKFRGLILSKKTLEKEESVGYNVRKFIVSLIVEAAITNCGFPYIPLLKNGKVIESSEKDEDRLKKIKDFITRGHILAVNNPSGNQEEQSLTLICNGTNEFDDLLKKFNYYVPEKEKYSRIKKAVKSSLNVIDSEWKNNQDLPDVLFSIFSDIFNLRKYEEKKYSIAMILYTWRSLKEESRYKINKEWTKYIEVYKKNVRDHRIKNHLDELNKTYHIVNDDEEFQRRRRFWDEVQDQIIKQSPFDISIAEDKPRKENKVFVSNDIYKFISNCEKYIQNEESLVLKYTLTPQNIMLFIHLVYRIYSHIPIVLMGETGYGKTFTLNFLSEIIGLNVQFIKISINSGTKEEDIRNFLRTNINKLMKERSDILKSKLRKAAENINTNSSIVDSINSLPIDENSEEIITSFEEIANKVSIYIDRLNVRSLCKYNVMNEEEKEEYKNNVLSNLSQIYQDIEKEQKLYLFFFDEVNTAPCQWFIKEIILDRYFEGKILPDYIHFVCTANPSRKLKNSFLQYSLDIEDPISIKESQEITNLMYKIDQIPESFVPYLFPADPNRELGSYSVSDYKNKKTFEQYLFDININSEFDISIDKKVENEFSIMTYPFIPINENNEKNMNKSIVKEGDKHHFSLTNMFSTSFDYSFFYNITNDPNKSISCSRAISHALSRINIFCCRLLYHVIYKDSSFSSIRDPERCIQIMRWAYKFGIYEKLEPELDFQQTIDRLRKAFIIGLSVSYWVRLSDQKQKDGSDSHRKIFIDSVCKYWKDLLDKWPTVSEIKESFKPPSYKEWIEIIQEECTHYADIFVDNDECVSKNNALSENIWVSYICIMTNIPLWIIGKPGTSKSLALSIVINKLLNRNSRNEKITKCPPLIEQTFMCSGTTTKEAIINQLSSIVYRSNFYEEDNYVIRIQILEQIEHADMSRFRPLAYLHNIIDNGYNSPSTPNISASVQLIGISNYKMDSAKLDRGILLLRCPLSEEDLKKTAFDIFKSTNMALHPNAKKGTRKYKILDKYKNKIEKIAKQYETKYENSNKITEKPFIGLRDFYGLIQSITDKIIKGSKNENEILTLIRRNFSGIPFNKKDLNNEKTTDLIKSIMKIIFPKTDFNKNYHFNKLICPITVVHGEYDDYNDYEEDDSETKEIIKTDIEKATVYYNMTDLVQANLNQEHCLLKTPIFRHIIISTVNAAAAFILFQYDFLKFTIHSKDSPYEFFFSHNMSNLPDTEWISYETRRLIEIMHKGKKTAIFIGNHPCFDNLYDIFNIRYQKEGIDSDDISKTFIATISCHGDSYSTIINSNFKAIIIIESDIYEKLPQSFLNRFEKFNLTYETELLDHDHKNSKNTIKDYKKKFQKDLSKAFGCYSDELFLSIYHILSNQEENNFTPNDLILLSIRPSELVYSTKNDLSFDEEEILNTLKNNSNLRSSIFHLLHGYGGNYRGSDNISTYLYKIWKMNKGIKAVVMVPSFNNIDKIPGYDFVKIDSLNSVNIDSRIKAEVKNIDEKTKRDKKPNPIVLSILISQGEFTVDYVLQYEYILNTIRRWCKDELKITNRPIHTLIIISMEHRIESLKINQSIEWPLLYLDTCYDDTIKTVTKDKNSIAFPLSLEQLVFTPLKDLFAKEGEEDEDIIDLEQLIQTARKSIHSHYTKNENELIENLIFKQKGNYQFYIHDPIRKLLTTVKEDESTEIETINDNILNLWAFKKITLLSSPPSSLIEYLSIKLVNCIGYIISIIIKLLFSGIDPAEEPNINKEIFKNNNIFNFMMNRPELMNSFYWLFNSDSIQVYPIEYRYSYDIRLPGQLSFYKLIWQLAMKINDSENILDSDSLFESLKSRLFKEDDINKVTENFDDLMNTKLSSSQSSLSFPFIAAYLLVVADSVRVDQNHKENFITWISCFIEILIGLYSNTLKFKKSQLKVKYIMFFLVNNKDLINFARNFTITFMFFPNPAAKKKGVVSESQIEASFKKLYSKIVSREIKDSVDPGKLPDKEQIHSEEAYLLSKFIGKKFIETINNLNIDIYAANYLFRNELSVLLSLHNSLNYCSSFVDPDYSYQSEPKYFLFIMTLQKFFIDYGDIISKEKDSNKKVYFSTKIGDFSKENVAEKLITTFVNDCIKKLELNNIIDADIATSSLLMYYMEMIYTVYIGLIDADIDDFDEDDYLSVEEEEEAPDEESY